MFADPPSRSVLEREGEMERLQGVFKQTFCLSDSGPAVLEHLEEMFEQQSTFNPDPIQMAALAARRDVILYIKTMAGIIDG